MINDDTIYNNSSSSNNKQEQTVLNISTTTTSNDSTKPSTLTTDELESAKILQHFSLTFVNATVPLTSSSAAPATALTTAAATNTVREGTGKAQDEEESSKALEEVSVTASSPSSSSSHQFLVNESTSKTNNEMIGLDNTSYNAIAYNNTTAMPINANSSSSVLATVTIGNAANDNNVGANGVVDKKRQRDCDSDPESDDENDDDEDEDDDGESGNKKGNSKKRVRHPVYPLWTVEEDELLMQKNIECGNDWAKISTFLTGRSRVDVKVRYKSIVSAEKKLWNIKDDERIFQLHKIHNADWKTISSHFSGRTKNAVRVRYKELKRLAFQPIKAPSLGSAKQIFYKRCHPHFHRNSTVIGSSDAANEQQEVQQQQKAMPAPQMEKSKKESLASTSKASSSSIFNDDAKKETEAKNNAAASSSSLFDTSIVIDDAMKISPQITQKEVNSRILTSIVHSSPQVRFPGPRPTIFCAPTPAAMNLPMHFPTMVNCYPTPGWPAQPTLTAIPTMFQQMPTNTTNGIPLMYSLFPQMPQFQQAPPKGI